ncbi:ABC transporter permease subunit [uncultured Gimesia sp.]|jgi:ABC-type transport system involved in multi-copper enzyme maturation permease subunit|uniref:ABC transporter permease n=1 Tax=uncultured Gimesia sp. TaxID=1678688 RepID=UPI0026263DAA|nr:ABC transporter permease subunit [uncultured Gimesia sp.]
MKLGKFQFSLPLLAKELTEQANRRRTYIIRTIYALLFLGCVGFIYIDQLSRLQNNPMAILGRGRQIFESMIYLQFTAIYLFLPAITCSVITQEKEHNSLGLLLITRLSPSTIILEKYLGRLITMVTFLMLGLPILAFAYTLGGVSPAMFLNALWLLVLTMFQVAALGVLCSSFFRTTVAAFIATYILGFLMLFGPSIAFELNLFFYGDFIRLLASAMQRIPFWDNSTLRGNWELNFLLFAPYWFDRFAWGGGITSIASTFVFSIPIILSTFVFLLMAHYFLVRRAFLPTRNLLLNVFKTLDRVFSRINHNRVTRGIVLVKDQVQLPEDAPIAWRETSKKSLGTFRYLFRILVALEVPVLFLCTLIATNSPQAVVDGAVMLLWLVWGLSVLLLAVSATSLISGERSHETLDVLLTTPISGRGLLDQKIAGVKRLSLVLLIPLLTIVLFESWWKWEYAYINPHNRNSYAIQWLPYLIGSLITIAIYLPMLIWLFCWIGMKVKSQTKAILSSLGVIIIWCILPFILVFPVFILNPSFDESSVIYGLFLSPASYIVINEIAEFQEFGTTWIPLIINTLIYGGCYYLFRAQCRNHIDENLGRLGNQESDSDRSPVLPLNSQSLLSSER